MIPSYGTGVPTDQVEKGKFDPKLIEAVRGLGQPIKELTGGEPGAYRGYWVGVHIPPGSNVKRGVGTRKPPLPSVAQAY
jgi:hypothetical protein